MISEQYTMILRYDPVSGLALSDAESKAYADEMVQKGAFDITVGTAFLLLSFQYYMKQRNLPYDKFIMVFEKDGISSTVLLADNYHLTYGLNGEFDYPCFNEDMMMELI